MVLQARKCTLCNAKRKAYGYCYRHYAEFVLKHRPRPTRDLTLAERLAFWSKAGQGGCVIWTGALNKHGYGRVGIGAKVFLAHRVAYELANGALPALVGVLHRCDTPACVNVDHLFIGSQAMNMADCVAKDRHVRGTRSPHAKLDEGKVLELLQDLRAHKEIAKAFQVSKSLIGLVKQRRRWKHVSLA